MLPALGAVGVVPGALSAAAVCAEVGAPSGRPFDVAGKRGEIRLARGGGGSVTLPRNAWGPNPLDPAADEDEAPLAADALSVLLHAPDVVRAEAVYSSARFVRT